MTRLGKQTPGGSTSDLLLPLLRMVEWQQGHVAFIKDFGLFIYYFFPYPDAIPSCYLLGNLAQGIRLEPDVEIISSNF